MNANPMEEQIGRLVGNLLAGGGEIFLPLPNEEGGATAQVECWSAISANTRNPRAAAALLAFLLGSLVDALQKRVVPRGMRGGKGAA